MAISERYRGSMNIGGPARGRMEKKVGRQRMPEIAQIAGKFPFPVTTFSSIACFFTTAENNERNGSDIDGNFIKFLVTGVVGIRGGNEKKKYDCGSIQV